MAARLMCRTMQISPEQSPHPEGMDAFQTARRHGRNNDTGRELITNIV
jgi:hypothetical protein